MAATGVERQVTALIGRCYTGLDAADLRQEVLRGLRRIMPVEAAFFATVDPVTLLFTSAVVEDPLGAATARFLDNEFGHQDVNKFAALAASADPTMSLDRATRGVRSASARYREIMGPLGLGDELRSALIAGQDCWGVLCLHLEDTSAGFTEQDLTVIRQIAPHLAAGLRRAIIQGHPAPNGPGVPGILVLDDNLALVSMSPEAERWLAEIADPGTRELPLPVYAAAARLARLERPPPAQPQPAVRLQTRSGRWLVLHATRLHGPAGPQIGVVIEPAPAAELSSLLLSAHGLTQAQTRVVALVLQGYSTRQIVERLHISANTVQEHLTAVIDRVGVRSRRELITTILADRH
jgi:DNA-binding CsgD family transcriptional regulator